MTRALLKVAVIIVVRKKQMRFSFRPVKSSEKDDRVSHWETLRCILVTVSRLRECERSRIPTNISSLRSHQILRKRSRETAARKIFCLPRVNI